MQPKPDTGRFRRALWRHLVSADDAQLATLLGVWREVGLPALPAFYEVISMLLVRDGDRWLDRGEEVIRQLGLDLDEVDGALHRYVTGDTAGGLAALRACRERRNPGRKVVFWHMFLETRENRLRQPAPPAPEVDLFQYWDRDPPPDVAAEMEKWSRVPTLRSYRRFDEAEARQYLADRHGAELVRAYDAAWHAAMKSDLFRIAYLLDHGGLYMDCDMRQVERTAEFVAAMNTPLQLTVQTHRPTCGVTNCVMHARPNHPLMARFLERCVRNILDENLRNPLQATGPAALSAMIDQMLRDRDGAAVLLRSTSVSLTELHRRLATNFGASYKKTSKSWQRALGTSGRAGDAGRGA
ncbi:glycosyltransferase family 32 protein [Falsiroseomonas sp. CW058]|uniref:glycosyltransferase family 32 protein n=1 Tax=Falsiroseomonas sp. CW058 TaxID=3388664 RepID=UPI003D320357